jgi:hypothetical protein
MPTHTVEVKLAAKNPEKVHSRVFEATTPDAVIRSVYISRPQSDTHSKAKITVEFLD